MHYLDLLTISSSLAGTGIVSSLSALLAKAGISLFYLSTSNTDFILVPEGKIDQAIAALKSTFTIYSEGDVELEDDEALSSSSSSSGPADPFSILQQNFLDMTGTSEIFKLSSATPPCTLLPDELRLCHIAKENRDACTHAILKLMLFTPDRSHFWSISETEDEMSLLIPDKFVPYFPPDALNASDIWRPIQRFKKTSYTEVGVVAALSAPLARGRISLLYVSTYLSAFILVQGKSLNAATLCLQAGKFQVVDHDCNAIH
jgi:hypothetical protein